MCVSVCLWTTLGHSHSSIFIDIYLNLHHLYKHIPNYMLIVFQGHRSKVKVMRSKTSIFSFSKITKKILDRFSLNKSPNTQCGLACMPIVFLSLTLKFKAKFSIFNSFTALISKIYRNVVLSTKIDISCKNFWSWSKSKVK